MRYPPLLITLFLIILIRPFTGLSTTFTGFFLIMVFLAAFYAFRHFRLLATSLAILGASSVALHFAGDQRSALQILSHGMSLVVMVLVTIAILSEVLRAKTASTDLVIGAVCLYLVIGLAWAFLYYSIYLISPGSIFASPGPVTLTAHASEAKFTEIFFFSLSALTTIGSSGEEALTPMARQLAVVESAMGQLYLAVLISRLVGFSTSSQTGTQ